MSLKYSPWTIGTNIAKMRENKGAVLTYATQLNPENFESGEYEGDNSAIGIRAYLNTEDSFYASLRRQCAFITKECEHVAALRWFDMGYQLKTSFPA